PGRDARKADGGVELVGGQLRRTRQPERSGAELPGLHDRRLDQALRHAAASACRVRGDLIDGGAVIPPLVEPHEPGYRTSQGCDDQFALAGAVKERLTGVEAQFVAVLVGDCLDSIDGHRVIPTYDGDGKPGSCA